MVKEMNDSFDHVIPVMLAGENHLKAPTFGPLYGKWSEDKKQRAYSNVSYILINSRNYVGGANGIKQQMESYVNIIGRGTRHRRNYRQIKVVLKGGSQDTYKCLQHSEPLLMIRGAR